MEFVRTFEELRDTDLPLAGGKGVNLAVMTRAGLQVPPGFVVTTAAYRRFVTLFGLQPDIERLAAAARAEEAASVEAASSAIRSLFGQEVPEAVARETAAAYRALGAGPVAVRSSATAEDLPGASFAGQQETYWNIEGEADLMEAVRRCWSSLWTPRAISYRARQGIRPGDVSLAVVVQMMVPAEVAGILFTANPVNGRRDHMVINASWGLGESVVSGQVTPDQWVVEHQTGNPVEHRPGHKTIMTVRTGLGTETVSVPEELQDRPCLGEADLKALAGLGRRVAEHFGSPQDIEWAQEGRRFYLVQSRPITSLFPLPQPAPPPDAGLRVYVCANYIQGFREPFTPMGVAAFRNFGRGVAALFGSPMPPGAAPAAFTSAAGRIYVDVGSGLRHPRGRKLALTIPGIVDWQIPVILRHLIEREPDLSPPNPRLPVKPPVKLFVRAGLRAFVTLLAPERNRERARRHMEEHVRRIAERASRTQGLEQRVRLFEEEGEQLLNTLAYHMFPLVAPAMASRFLIEDKVREWFGDASAFQPLLRSLAHNPTTEMDLALWAVSRRLKAEGAEPAAGHPAVQEFLDVYGHRGLREIDIGMPRWRDDPTQVLTMLRNYLGHGEESDPEAHFRRGAQEAEQAAAGLIDRVRREKGALRALWLGFFVRRMRSLLGMREYPKFMAVKLFGIFREVARGAGEELVAAGRLDRAEDVFFVDLRDLASTKDLRALSAANREEYHRELERRSVPRVMTSTGEAFYGAPQAADGALMGTPASAGIHEGRVRVIFDPRGAHLEPGEVLVAPGTDPAWTPLFLTAGALVMEIGGTMSHGSVVAREYGIPAVVGVPGATEQLRTGQLVRVDGESGRVIPLD